jgi:dimethylamine/trimethylamine dehydrogenase
MSDSDYSEALLAAYEDEVVGEAYFRGLSERFEVAAQREKLALLAELERHTAGVILPLVDRHRLSPRPPSVLDELGRSEAASYGGADWLGLMREMAGTYQVYVEEFRALEKMAPEDDRAALARLTEHESLIIDFAERELAARADSLDAIRDFLEDVTPTRRLA